MLHTEQNQHAEPALADLQCTEVQVDLIDLLHF